MKRIGILLYFFFFAILECSGQALSPCTIPTINPGFELPRIGSSLEFVKYWNVPGWKTTDPTNEIEIWHDGFNGVRAFEGQQFVELNANNPASLYQDYNTPSPTVFHIHFAHRGRTGTDVCRLYAGPPNGISTTVIEASDNNLKWGEHTAQYTVPNGQSITRFSFYSLFPQTSGIGNFLDDIQIVADNDIIGPNPITVCGLAGQVNTTASGVGSWIPFSSNPSLTTINQTPNDPNNTTIISGFQTLGTYHYTWKTGYCSPTLTVDVVAAPIAPTVTSNSPVPSGSTINLSTPKSPNVISYAWTGPNRWTSNAQSPTIPNAALNQGGNYTLVTTSADGCKSPPTTISVMVYNGRFNQSICVSNTLVLNIATTATATAYQWTGPNGFSSVAQSTTITNVTAAMSGTYSMVATTSIGSITELTQVSVFSAPRATAINSNAPQCEGSMLTINTDNIVGATYHWIGPNGFVQNLATSLLVRNPATPAMRGTYTVTITSPEGCVSNPLSQFIDVIDGVSEPIVSSNLPVCVGTPIYFSTELTGSTYNYAWSGPKGFTSNVKNPVITNTDSSINGTYTLQVTVPGLPCQYPPAMIAINASSYPSVDAGPDLTISQNSSEKIWAVASGEALTYKWTPAIYLDNDAILNPTVINPKKDTSYLLQVTNFDGCSTSSFMKITVPFFAPNTFTPNGDGIEDVWEIQGLENYPGCIIQIFNRWEHQIFFSAGYNTPWDGTVGANPLPAGTYYYVIDLKDGKSLRSGYVALLR